MNIEQSLKTMKRGVVEVFEEKALKERLSRGKSYRRSRIPARRVAARQAAIWSAR